MILKMKKSQIKTPKLSRDMVFQGSYRAGRLRPTWHVLAISAGAVITAVSLVMVAV